MSLLYYVLFIICNVFCTFESNIVSAKINSSNINKKSNLYEDIKNKIELIKKDCGSLCSIDESTYKPISDDSKFYYVPI